MKLAFLLLTFVALIESKRVKTQKNKKTQKKQVNFLN